MSVMAQQLDYVHNAMSVLFKSGMHQYRVRGQPRYDKKSNDAKTGERLVRRNSLTTLHSLPTSDALELGRQKTVPHGFNEDGLETYFGDTWIGERSRRHSIEKEIEIKESELYKSNKPPPLFYEHVTYKPSKTSQAKAEYSLMLNEPAYKNTYLGNITFCGKLMQANASLGIFMTLNSTGSRYPCIPYNMKVIMRPCAMVNPDIEAIVEAILYCNGFTEHQNIAKKLTLLFDLLKVQLPRQPDYMLGLGTVRSILDVAVKKLHGRRIPMHHSEGGSLVDTFAIHDGLNAIDEDTATQQDFAVIYSINVILVPMMRNKDDIALLKSISRDVFPQSVRPKSGILGYDPELVSSVQEQLALDNLQATAEHVSKILQFYTALQHRQGVILIGPAGSGKTTCYQTLSRAMNSLHGRSSDPDKDPSDDLKAQKSLTFHTNQKLKILEKSEARKKSLIISKFKKISQTASGVATSLGRLFKDTGRKKRIMYPKVDISAIHPNAYTEQELFGYYDEEGIWKDGIIAKIIHDSYVQVGSGKHYVMNFDERKNKERVDKPSVIEKWIVMDGVVGSHWAESMNTLQDNHRTLVLANGEKIRILDETMLIYEMADLTSASPSTITKSSLVHCHPDTVLWKSVYESWCQAAKQTWMISATGSKILEGLADDLFGPTLKFLMEDCTFSLTSDLYRSFTTANQGVYGQQEVMSFCRIMSSLMNMKLLRSDWEKQATAGSPKEAEVESPSRFTISPGLRTDTTSRWSQMTGSTRIDEQIPNYTNILKNMFAFAYIWGFGGHIHERNMGKFNKFARELLHRTSYPLNLPYSGSVFDFCVDIEQGVMIKWNERSQEKIRNLPIHYAVTSDVERYYYLLDIMTRSSHPVLLTGPPGVGKTAVVQNLVSLKHQFTRVPISAGLSAPMFQNTVTNFVSELWKKEATTHSIPVGGATSSRALKIKHLFFLDDLNMAASNVNGIQPTLESLREMMSKSKVYNRQRLVQEKTVGAEFIAACTSPAVAGSGCGTSCHMITSRLTRLFTVLTYFTPSVEGMQAIYSKTIQTWLEEFPTYSVEHHYEFANALTNGILDLYSLVKERFRPSPANAHYVFTLRDIANIMEGILMLSPRSKILAKARGKKRKESKDQDAMKMQIKATQMPVIDKSRLRTGSWAGLSEKDAAQGAPPMMRVIARLWCHECTRTLGDRLITNEDTDWFRQTLYNLVECHFCTGQNEQRTKMSAIHEEYTAFSRATPVHRKTPPPPLLGAKVTTPQSQKSISATSDYGDLPPGTASTMTITEMMATTPYTEDGQTIAEDATTMEYVTPLTEGGFTEVTTDIVTPFSTEYSQSLSTRQHTANQSRLEDSDTPGATTEGDTDSDETSSSESGSSEEDDTTTPGASTYTSDTRQRMELTKDNVETLADADNLTSYSSEISLRFGSPSTDMLSENNSMGLKVGIAPGTPSLLKKSGSRKDVKRGVTFKTGLIADKEFNAYDGPLLGMHQVKQPNEELTDIMFTKYIMTTYTEAAGLKPEKGYVECNESTLNDALQTCLALYNYGTSQKLDLVFFKDAIQHITRLFRIMAVQCGHALLLGMTYCTGRATLTRLAAYISNSKLYEPKPQHDSGRNRAILHEHIKRLCHTAAFSGKQIVLLIHEDLGEDCLQDVCSLMAEGTCPGLYTEEEQQSIATQITSGVIQVKLFEKVQQAFEKFVKRVKQNLHVVVLLGYNSCTNYRQLSPLYKQLTAFPKLLHASMCIDVYKPWAREAHVQVAITWLKDTSSRIIVPWSVDVHSVYDQIVAVAEAMSYMHTSAREVIQSIYRQSKHVFKFFTPLTFKEFVHVFKVVAASIAQKEKHKMARFELGVAKINEAYDSIARYKQDVADLLPKLHRSQQTIDSHVRVIEDRRAEFMHAREVCKIEEEKIEQLIGPLEKLRKDAEIEFDKVNPVYFTALSALNALDEHNVAELKSYNKPPALVVEVTKALCLMFDKPMDWENGKMLLASDNFIKELEFYDKDNIHPRIFNGIEIFVHNPNFAPEVIKTASMAAASISQWIHAVYEYAKIHQMMVPRLKALMDAEDDLKQAQTILGEKRVAANKIKAELEQRIEMHREAVKKTKSIDRQIKAIEKKIDDATKVVKSMDMQHNLWLMEMKNSQGRLKTLPGDALVTAACVCYHGPLDVTNRAILLDDWLRRCHMGSFDVQLTKPRKEKRSALSARLDNLLRPTPDIESPSHLTHLAVDEEAARLHGSSISSSRIPSSTNQSSKPSIYYNTNNILRTGIHITNYSAESYEERHSQYEYKKEPSLVSVRDDYSLQDVLSSFDELSEWKLSNLPTDLQAIQNALIMRVSCHNRRHCWPLLIDPDNMAPIWVRTLQNSKHIIREKDVTLPQTADSRETESYLQSSHNTGVTWTDGVEEELQQEDQTMSLTETEITPDSQPVSLSRPETDSTDLRPVTSITDISDNFQICIDLDLEKPPDNLWIIPADDEYIDTRIVNAIVYGITVLVTHVERKPLDPLFRGLLLKQYSTDREGIQVVRVGDMQFRYHPDFCLYLSSSVPLSLEGDGMTALPIDKVSVIDLTLSEEAMMDCFLFEIMKFERPEFESQKKSIEADLLMHKNNLNKDQENVLDQTLSIDSPILHEDTMLDMLIACQEEVARSQDILDQTQYLREHLEEKRVHYLSVASNATMLYDIIKTMIVLSPYYHMTFTTYLKIFVDIIKSRQRGKNNSGALKPRAQELINATTSTIYKYMSLMMFEDDLSLFTLLVTMERMRLSRQLTNEELALFVEGIDSSEVADTIILDYKPTWISDKVWMDCAALETNIKTFKGLRQSLAKHQSQWKEYFSCQVSLIASIPGNQMQHMTIFEKCLLWRICTPSRLSEVARALVMYELAGVVSPKKQFDITDVYKYSKATEPIVFLTPGLTKGQLCNNPLDEIHSLARSLDIEGTVHSITLGVDTQMKEVISLLETCITSGYWLILQNCHLSRPWSQELLDLLKHLVDGYSLPEQLSKNATKTSLSLSREVTNFTTNTSNTNIPAVQPNVHQQFRLWLITDGTHQRLLPGLVIQKGLKVSCELTDSFKNTVLLTYNSICRRVGEVGFDKSTFLPLVLMHSVLQHRTYYQRAGFSSPLSWTYEDMHLALEVIHISMELDDADAAVLDTIQRLYTGHILDDLDMTSVASFCKNVLCDYIQDSCVFKLFNKIIEEDQPLSMVLSQMEDVDASTIGLAKTADIELSTNRSRNLIESLHEVSSIPTSYVGQLDTKVTLSQISSISNVVKDLPDLPNTSRDQLYPLELYIHSEVEALKRLITFIQSDIALLNLVVKGDIAMTEETRQLLLAINSHMVPKTWLSESFPTYQHISEWLGDIKTRIFAITEYVNEGSKTPCYNLSVFSRPDRFIQTILQNHARRQFRDLQSFHLEAQVQGSHISPTEPPDEGVRIKGLKLHNASWSIHKGIITNIAMVTNDTCDMPIILLKPVETRLSKNGYNHYHCPVFMSRSLVHVSSCNVITYLDLPCNGSGVNWKERRVYITSHVCN